LFETFDVQGIRATSNPRKHDKIITNAGGVSNAYTEDDVTVFWANISCKLPGKVIWMEADRMTTLDVSEANFKAEREVVQRRTVDAHRQPSVRRPERAAL